MKNAFINGDGVLTAFGYVDLNNADILVEVDDDFDMPLGCAQYSNGTWAAYKAPILPAMAAAAALSGGLTIASTGTPSLNGTYAVEALSQADIFAVETGLNANKGFPGGVATFNYQDISGVFHAFTEANFTDFATVVRDYVYALKSVIAGASTTLPSSTATIA